MKFSTLDLRAISPFLTKKLGGWKSNRLNFLSPSTGFLLFDLSFDLEDSLLSRACDLILGLLLRKFLIPSGMFFFWDGLGSFDFALDLSLVGGSIYLEEINPASGFDMGINFFC